MAYSPTMQRWMQEEPNQATYIDGPNLYQALLRNPINHLDPNGTLTEKELAGVIYGETANIYPQLKAGATVGGPDNWDPNSVEQLRQARGYLALVVSNGGKTIAPVIPSAEELKKPLVKRVWDDSLEVAKSFLALPEDKKKGLENCKHFVFWVSTDGKTPDKKPKIPADWPYTQADKIIATFGPFRKLDKSGDVPISNNIYVFIYQGIK